MKTKLFSVSIHDCRVDTFRSGGKGGQNQNKVSSGVRVVHKPSGAVGECRETRSQHQNKRTAFRRMAETREFQTWCKLQAARIAGEPSIDDQVDALMRDENLRIEVKNQRGQWEQETRLE